MQFTFSPAGSCDPAFVCKRLDEFRPTLSTDARNEQLSLLRLRLEKLEIRRCGFHAFRHGKETVLDGEKSRWQQGKIASVTPIHARRDRFVRLLAAHGPTAIDMEFATLDCWLPGPRTNLLAYSYYWDSKCGHVRSD